MTHHHAVLGRSAVLWTSRLGVYLDMSTWARIVIAQRVERQKWRGGDGLHVVVDGTQGAGAGLRLVQVPPRVGVGLATAPSCSGLYYVR